MTTLFILGLMFFGALASLVLLPLLLLKLAFVLVFAVVLIPLKLLGLLTRVAFKGVFWLALLLVPLAILAFPLVVMAFGAWLLFRAFRPRRPPQAYVVS